MQQFAKDLGAWKHKKHNKPNSPKKQKPAKVATELGEMKSVKPTQSATQPSVLLFRDVVSIAQDSFLSAQAWMLLSIHDLSQLSALHWK